MKSRLSILLLFLTISGCSFTSTRDLVTSTPHPPAPSPSLTTTPPVIPTIISSPGPTLTATFSPYMGKPFSIVFTREGNLWIANIGENITERQLTFETQGMRIIDFDVSPDGTRIAYIPYQLEPLNSLIKLVDISTSNTSVILGENDPFSEISVVWLDNTTIAYKNQDHMVPTFTTESVEIITTYIVYDLSTKKQLGITDFLYIRPSPDRRFRLGCSGGVAGCGWYTLQDLVNGKQYVLEGNIELGGFIGWSPDSRSMLFNTVTSPDICTSQLIVVDAETLEQKAITTEEENVWNASFSPTGNLLFYGQQEVKDLASCMPGDVDYRVLDLDNQQTYGIFIDFQIDFWYFSWTPDGQRLLFFPNGRSNGYENELWSMDLDGLHLQPLLANIADFKVLESIP